MFLNQYFIQILQEVAVQNNEHSLQSVQQTLDDKLREMNGIAVEISSNPNLLPHRITSDMYDAMTAKEELNYTLTNGFLEDVLLYIKGSSYLYSSTSTYSKKMFINQIVPYENWTLENFVSNLEQLRMPAIRPAEKIKNTSSSHASLHGERILTYMIPIPVNSPKPYGVVLFLIKDATIQQLLHGAVQDSEGSVMLVNSERQLLTAYNANEEWAVQAFQALQRNGDSAGSSIMRINGQRYVVATVQSGQTGWEYVTTTPYMAVMSKAIQAQKQSLIVISLVLVLGLFIIYISMRYNYAPIVKLFAFARGRLGTVLTSIQQITDGIEVISEDREKLSQKLESSRTAIQQHLLLSLLQGRGGTSESLIEQGREVGLMLEGPVYYVMLIHVHRLNNMPIAKRQAAVESIEQIMNAFLTAYKADLSDKDGFVYIGVTDSSRAEIEDRLMQLIAPIAKVADGEVALAMGNLYEDMNDIGKSYIEATTAINYRLIKGLNQLIPFHALGLEQSGAHWYPKYAIEQLEAYVLRGDLTGIKRIVTDVLNQMNEQHVNLYIARCICYDMINTVIKALFLKDGRLIVPDSPDVLQLTKFETMQEFAQLMEELCSYAARQADDSEQKADQQVTSWMAYIQTHFQSAEFSVPSMAAHFELSVSHIQRIFKERTGCTITEQLNEVRIQQAKKLLVESDMPIKDIVCEVGYYDVSSFIRKFKQSTFLTPGEYRKHHAGRE
ncbi:helix-turn-helix domain-containing protein [Paenibacillus cellulosilyticus]|nr:helix-turn-helix domain-containing protein [Paenibacillus cellulosilyticus]